MSFARQSDKSGKSKSSQGKLPLEISLKILNVVLVNYKKIYTDWAYWISPLIKLSFNIEMITRMTMISL